MNENNDPNSLARALAMPDDFSSIPSHVHVIYKAAYSYYENKRNPIETAPKDGTEILLYIPIEWSDDSKDPGENRIGSGYYICSGWFSKNAWINRLGHYFKSETPTHWQPLPELPTDQSP